MTNTEANEHQGAIAALIAMAAMSRPLTGFTNASIAIKLTASPITRSTVYGFSSLE